MRIFLAEGNSDIRLGLELALNNEPGMIVTGIAVRAKGLIEQIGATRPDVLLLSWHLPRVEGTDILARLKDLTMQPQVVVMSSRPELEAVAMAAGATAFVSTDRSSENLLAVLRKMRSESESGVEPTVELDNS